MSTILVSGAIANKPFNGGEAWVRLSWVLGLKKLGHRVIFVEEIHPKTCTDPRGQECAFETSMHLAYFKQVIARFGLEGSAALVYDGGGRIHGLLRDELIRAAESAELLINISGHLGWPEMMSRIGCKAYIDIDPGFTQFWHADPASAFKLSEHDFYYTIGKNIGTPACEIPTGGIAWRHVDQPVVLSNWPIFGEKCEEPSSKFEIRNSKGERGIRFTTIASWRGSFGPVYFAGKSFGLKVHEFRKFIELPKRSAARFEIALDIHPADEKDRAALIDNGWLLVDPRNACGGPMEFREYVQKSDAEFSVAQGIYVATNSGWFSDRTVRYLASGKPALVQHTGWSGDASGGEGLVTFRTLDEAITGAADIAARYESHSRAARRIAEEHFDSDRVLTKLLAEMGVA